jgi:glycosyltransferase involved in cell wall biosynthesis
MMSLESTPDTSLSTQRDRVRVLHVHSGNLHGGVETFLRTMAEHRAHAPTLTTDFALCYEGRIARDLRSAGATVHQLGTVRVRSPRSVLRARRELARLVQARRYDVVVCHSVWSQSLFARTALRLGARLVFYMHDVPNSFGWLDRWASRTTPDLVVCNSVFTETSGRWIFPTAPRRVVRYPSALGTDEGATARASLRASLGAGADAIVILHAGRMQQWKGQKLLIAALAELRTHARWACWIAGGAQRPGEAAYEQELREEVRRLGLAERVKFLGQRDDVPALMRAADVHCQPNVGPEPFGLVFVEALAAGLPVVTTAMGGPLEIVNASCGVLVPPVARSLAASLAELIDDNDKRVALSKAAPARARDLCDPVGRTRDLARELVSLAATTAWRDAPARAALSRGRSTDAILSVVAAALRERGGRYELIVDLGCGRGDCARNLRGMYEGYVGCDAVRYEGFPREDSVTFRQVDLNRTPYPLDSACANAVVCVETIEHLENPRALVREMARIVRPGGLIVVTTPNQLSLMSKLHLVARSQFHAFQEAPGLYPAHITALLEGDLRRIARECGFTDVDICYTDYGRIPFTDWHWPNAAGARGQWFSDNVVMLARRP